MWQAFSSTQGVGRSRRFLVEIRPGRAVGPRIHRNPIVLHDVFFRDGGASAGQVKANLSA